MIDFFSDEYQQDLKQKSLDLIGINSVDDFCEAVYIYRKSFVEELKIIRPQSVFSEYEMVQAFESDMMTYIIDNYICKIDGLFERIVSILRSTENNRVNELFKYICDFCNNWMYVGAIDLCQPLFRAREVGNYRHDIEELYHFPFDKISAAVQNNRFSNKRRVMLYTAETVEGALFETGINDVNKANVALFFPKYSNFYRTSVITIENSLQKELQALEWDTFSGLKISYDNDYLTFAKRNIYGYLAEFILFQILHFPTSSSDGKKFIPQYILPQILMDLMITKFGISIISYRSANLFIRNGVDKFKDYHDSNVSFLVPPIDAGYNMDYLENFYYEEWVQGDPLIEVDRVYNKIDILFEKVKTSNQDFIMTDYIIYLRRITDYLDYRCENDAKNNNTVKIAASLFWGFLNKIEPFIINPEAYGVRKCK